MTIPAETGIYDSADQTVIDTFFGLVPDMIVPVLGIVALGVVILFVMSMLQGAIGRLILDEKNRRYIRNAKRRGDDVY